MKRNETKEEEEEKTRPVDIFFVPPSLNKTNETQPTKKELKERKTEQ